MEILKFMGIKRRVHWGIKRKVLPKLFLVTFGINTLEIFKVLERIMVSILNFKYIYIYKMLEFGTSISSTHNPLKKK